ncbi:MAG: hypothetical protein Q7J60_16760 [Bradyrhizobium sp.]|nr:hypothetical protein [Bradyrhizobium sp.]
MGFFSKDIKTMDDLLLHGLQDIELGHDDIVRFLTTNLNVNRKAAS